MLICRIDEGVYGQRKVGNPWFRMFLGAFRPIVKLGDGSITEVPGFVVNQKPSVISNI